MNIEQKWVIIVSKISSTNRVVSRVQKYNLWVSQSCIILLGIATIFIATEYHNLLFWKTDNNTKALESTAHFE